MVKFNRLASKGLNPSGFSSISGLLQYWHTIDHSHRNGVYNIEAIVLLGVALMKNIISLALALSFVGVGSVAFAADATAPADTTAAPAAAPAKKTTAHKHHARKHKAAAKAAAPAAAPKAETK